MVENVRTLPHSLEAERAVLGAAFVDPETFAIAASILTAKDFFRAAHAMTFDAIADLVADGLPPDLVLAKEELERKGLLDEAGGPAYIASLVDGIPRATNVSYYAEIVAEKSRLRQVVYKANAILANAYEQTDSSTRIIEEGINELTGAVAGVTGGLISLDDAIAEYINGIVSGTASAPVSTGFIDVDKFLGGFKRSDLVIVAARPSVGKSSLAMAIAENMAKNDEHSIIFSIEMSQASVAARHLAWRSKVPSEKIERGTATDAEYAAVSNAASPHAQIPIWIESSAKTVTEIGAWARRAKNKNGKLSCIVVDYLQLLIPERSTGNTEADIAAISHALKRLAKELDIVVVAISQLSRSPEARKDKRPQLQDLRGSGALEQDADLAVLLFREEMHKQDSEQQGVAEFIVAKNRNGPTGTVKLAFIKELALFANLAF